MTARRLICPCNAVRQVDRTSGFCSLARLSRLSGGKLGLTSLLGSGVEPTFVPPELGHVSGLRRDVLLSSRVPLESVHVQPEVRPRAGALVFTVGVKFYV